MKPPGPTSPAPLGALHARRARKDRWLSSNWALSALALILAFLIWEVVYRQISQSLAIQVRVEPKLSSEHRYHAIVRDSVTLHLHGPRAELDEALKELGSERVIRVLISDKEAEQGRLQVRDLGRFQFPFRRSLAESIEPARVEVYRLVQRTLLIQPPRVDQIKGVKEGVDVQVEVPPEEQEISVSTTADTSLVPEIVTADPIDVHVDFLKIQDTQAVLPPTPRTIRLTFHQWLNDATNGIYRQPLAPYLESIDAKLTYMPLKEMKITRPYVFLNVDPDQYVVTLGQSNPKEFDAANQTYTGRFVGWADELAKLKDAADRGQWGYMIIVLPSTLPKEPGKKADLVIAEVHPAPIDFPHVSFQPTGAASQANLSIERKAE